MNGTLEDSNLSVWKLCCIATNNYTVDPESEGEPHNCKDYGEGQPQLVVLDTMTWITQTIQSLHLTRIAFKGL